MMSSKLQTFMESPMNIKGGKDTPASMLVAPGMDVGLADVAEDWIREIIASDDPDTEFDILIAHISGVLRNLKLVQKHYREFIRHSA